MKRVFWTGLLAAFISATAICHVFALADISSSYSSPNPVKAGNLVSAGNNSDQITLANSSNGQHLLGVALSVKDSAVSINSPAGNKYTVQVASSGTVNAYVSTINGDIASGDAISVSPLSGIGMNAGTSGEQTIGIAEASFSSNSQGKQYTVINKSGQKKQVLIGTVPIAISIGNGSSTGKGSATSGFVGNLKTAAADIVGHPVSNLQAILSFLVVIIALSALIALVYGAIHNAVVAIGRNPLAKVSIYKSLSGVAGVAFLIALIAMSIIYFTLR